MTKVRNSDIIALVNGGALLISSSTLDNAQGYKAFRLKKALKDAFADIQKAEGDILRECGIGDAAETQRRQAELSSKGQLTEEERAEFDSTADSIAKANGRIRELHADTSELDIRTLPYEAWRQLQKENAEQTVGNRRVNLLGGEMELLLYGIFWLDPDDNDKKKTDGANRCGKTEAKK